ncbi:flagellar protein FliO/FliZ [Dongia mobilis]|uniref:Flagellar protein FliO/FliZ n=1 Tax=Dongia mobilis TaxID=578943 RepID=A0A4R6WS08_9PROT|nr:flagellar biosynthetic protein FliO [Dongia mobilis]TDQ84395.1 flagellar protein FliO/FliZ [Dongia mobilis]
MDSEYLRFILALVLVLGLILLLAWVLRRFGAGGLVRPGGRRRLHVVESAMAGPRHRLMLVRRDDTEHLILMGPNGDLVVERGIRNGGVAASLSFGDELGRHRSEGPTLRAERPDNLPPKGGDV